jgi:hypothetical protein
MKTPKFDVTEKAQQTRNYLLQLLPPGGPHRLPTERLAELVDVRPQTVRRGICTDGHYLGLIPVKLPNRRLIFIV